jgi:hypothetical protein
LQHQHQLGKRLHAPSETKSLEMELAKCYAGIKLKIQMPSRKPFC